jgi:plastocyanin
MKAMRVDRSPEVCGRTQAFEALRFGADGGVRDAVVSIDDPPAAHGSGNVFVDQVGCRYTPHVVTVTVGQTLEVHDGDDLLHNVHAVWTAPEQATWFNLATPSKGIAVRRPVTRAGVAHLVCDAGHTWMSGWVLAFDHALHAVTAEDGSFRLQGVPVGRHVLRLWHEGWRVEGDDGGRPRFSPPVVRTKDVEVGADSEARVDLDLSE